MLIWFQDVTNLAAAVIRSFGVYACLRTQAWWVALVQIFAGVGVIFKCLAFWTEAHSSLKQYYYESQDFIEFEIFFLTLSKARMEWFWIVVVRKTWKTDWVILNTITFSLHTWGVCLHLLEHSPPWWSHSSKSHPSPSSAPLGQSGTWLHTLSNGTHCSVTPGHCHWPSGHLKGGRPHACSVPSSELSPQSFLPSQIYAWK